MQVDRTGAQVPRPWVGDPFWVAPTAARVALLLLYEGELIEDAAAALGVTVGAVAAECALQGHEYEEQGGGDGIFEEMSYWCCCYCGANEDRRFDG